MILDDDRPGMVTVQTQQDMTQTIENNKVMRERHPARSTNKLLARGVPITVAEQALREGWDQDDWKKWLNDPDNAAFRVWPGRV
jgi:hypothetical protein